MGMKNGGVIFIQLGVRSVHGELLKKGTAKTLRTPRTEEVQRKSLRSLRLGGEKSSFFSELIMHPFTNSTINYLLHFINAVSAC